MERIGERGGGGVVEGVRRGVEGEERKGEGESNSGNRRRRLCVRAQTLYTR